VDRESAYEVLKNRSGAMAEAGAKAAEQAGAAGQDDGWMGEVKDLLFGSTGPRGGKRDGLVQAMAKSTARKMGTQIGNQILRGVLGGIFGGRR
jgi:hypothetical protein